VYDAIVVGARCAGAVTAMLLARRGYRVLLVDKARFPSDTVSTLYIQPEGVGLLELWGLLREVADRGTPAIRAWRWTAERLELRGFPWSESPSLPGYAPRRLVLDAILVAAARAAGAEVREEFTVRELVERDGSVCGIRGRSGSAGGVVEEQARVVIGADGRQSTVARAVAAPRYAEHPPLTCAYYAYFADLPCDGLEQHARAGQGVILLPTNDDLSLAAFVLPNSTFREVKADPHAALKRVTREMGDVGARLSEAKLASRFVGMANLPNFFCRPFGAGWVLVGDAGHLRDPITGHGITDAFRDARLLTEALHDCWADGASWDARLKEYAELRDRLATPSYEWTLRVAELRPVGARLEHALRSLTREPELVSLFLGLNAGTVATSRFFEDPRVKRLLT